MSTNAETKNGAPCAAAVDSRTERAIRLLIATPGDSFTQKLERFRAFYPAVTTAKRNGMKHKQIIKIIADGGLKLYPALFDKLLAAMKRSKAVSQCPHCGQSVDQKSPEFAAQRTPTEDFSNDTLGATDSESLT